MAKNITRRALNQRLTSGDWRKSVTIYEKGLMRVQLVNNKTGRVQTRTVVANG